MKKLRWNAAILAAGSILLGGVVVAQGVDEVKVQATRAVSAKIVGRTASGVPIKDLSLTYGVSLEGLNLATHSGVTEAEKRVNDAALAACKEIGRQYQDATPSDRECAETAASKALVTLHTMVASAEKAVTK